MVDNLCTGDCMFKSRRERLKSLPVTYDSCVSNQLPLEFVRRHRNSDVTAPKSIQNNTLREVQSDPYTHTLIPTTDVGVKSYCEWRPRRHSSSTTITSRVNDIINEDTILVERNLDCKFVLNPVEFQKFCYKAEVSKNNPFKSELFLRVLYMLSCLDTKDHEPLPSIQDQFLSDEQIRENLLKELRVGVSRLNQESNQDISGGKSGTVTPHEFICCTIPHMIHRQSFANIKSATGELSHVSSMASIDGSDHNSDQSDSVGSHHNSNSVTHHHNTSGGSNSKRKSAVGKLSGREKNLFAPLTF